MHYNNDSLTALKLWNYGWYDDLMTKMMKMLDKYDANDVRQWLNYDADERERKRERDWSGMGNNILAWYLLQWEILK